MDSDGGFFRSLASWIDRRRVVVVSVLNAIILTATLVLLLVALVPGPPKTAHAAGRTNATAPRLDSASGAAPSSASRAAANSRVAPSQPVTPVEGSRPRRVLIRRPASAE